MRSFVAVLWGCALLAPVVGATAGTLAQFRTPLGDIEVELFDSDKPVTVQNFIRCIQQGLFRDGFIQRWEPGFVIQGGGYYVTNRQAAQPMIDFVAAIDPIVNEYQVGRTFSNTYGTIAMARKEGQTNSATSQWFFNLGDNSGLDAVDGGFTVFGRMVRGTNVLDRFNLTSTDNGIYSLYLNNLLNKVPVLSSNPTFDDLVYVDISLLQVQLVTAAGGAQVIHWTSVAGKPNIVEFTAQFPPAWQELFRTNGTGQAMQYVVAPSTSERARFYRVRVDY
jgi:cyclophilin family peptidyl-prolyl cis-trans isomerase